MVIIKIPNQIYHVPVNVFIGEYSSYKNYLLNCYDVSLSDDEDGRNAGCVVPVEDNDGCSIITMWLDKLSNNDYTSLSSLTHESIHAANALFDIIGAKRDDKNDEHLAYVSQYIFKQTIVTFNKNITIKKKNNNRKGIKKE